MSGAATTFNDIELTIDDPVAVLRLNRPEKLNAFTYDTLREIRAAIDAAAADTRVVGIVITGNGRGFCAGLDAATLGAVTSAPAAPLMSDLRIASRAASFTTVFLKRGLIAEHGSSWLLPRLVGTGRALDLLWMSDRIDAETALRVGLVESVVEADALLDAATNYIRRLAVTSAPTAVAETKRLIHRHLGAGYVDALREADASQWKFVAAPDAREGAAALLEKRIPNFTRLGESK